MWSNIYDSQKKSYARTIWNGFLRQFTWQTRAATSVVSKLSYWWRARWPVRFHGYISTKAHPIWYVWNMSFYNFFDYAPSWCFIYYTFMMSSTKTSVHVVCVRAKVVVRTITYTLGLLGLGSQLECYQAKNVLHYQC